MKNNLYSKLFDFDITKYKTRKHERDELTFEKIEKIEKIEKSQRKERKES